MCATAGAGIYGVVGLERMLAFVTGPAWQTADSAMETEIGVQGVCFGKVVTALSPRGGPFNWEQIVWHELAHVFAVQRSRSRVPRWFTEGLSEDRKSVV